MITSRSLLVCRVLGSLLIGSLWGCSPTETEEPVSAELAPLPKGFPAPLIPIENLQSAVKVELGRHLFYDKRMSGNGTQSCASCHKQALGFTDGLAHSVGSTGQMHPRSAMGLTNVAYVSALTWANPLLRTLEEQALGPMFGEHPVELGLAGKEDELLARLASDARYPALFARAFPGDARPISLANITRALASFERTLISGRSAYDRFLYGNESSALSDAAKRGMDLFFSEKLECFHCHGGFNFSDATTSEQSTFDETNFHITGLYNIAGTGAYPTGNQGLYELTGKDRDRGRFRAPTLRNVAVTAPYMHDGSVATLEDVLDHYARGGRNVTGGPNAGDGALHPNKSLFVRPFSLSTQERSDVIEFLNALTDPTFLQDPAFSDPFASK
jgi:cytochrome c peroxidase